MKRTEAAIFGALGAALAGVGAFVGVQAVHAPPRAALTRDTAEAAADLSGAAANDGAALSHVRKSSLAPPLPHDYPDIARKLAEGRGATYMDAILAARQGNVARWVERRGNPITVWIQPTTALPDFWPEFLPRVRDAFYTWAAAGVPLRFLFVEDSAAAEAHVTWVNRFDDSAAGKTYWERDKNWWIVGANIELALHRPTGEAYDQQMIRTIALHEVGHLIGLDHSPSPDDIMAARVHVTGLSAADLKTASLIYALPPGAVTAPTPTSARRPAASPPE